MRKRHREFRKPFAKRGRKKSNSERVTDDALRSQKNGANESTVLWFSRIYLGGIPPTITDDSAFLSFISVLSAIEALAGYRYSDVRGGGLGGGKASRYFVQVSNCLLEVARGIPSYWRSATQVGLR